MLGLSVLPGINGTRAILFAWFCSVLTSRELFLQRNNNLGYNNSKCFMGTDKFCFCFCYVFIKKSASILYSYGWKLNAVYTAGRGVQMQNFVSTSSLISDIPYCSFRLMFMKLRQPAEIYNAEIVGKIKEKALNLVSRILVNSEWPGICKCYARCLCYSI